MAARTVTTKGLRELIRAADAAGKETKKAVRGRLREVAKPVLEQWRGELAGYDAGSAGKLGISVRRTGMVSVEQRAKRTTGQRPNFGRLQMAQGMRALDANAQEIELGLEQAVDDIADVFERR